MKKLLIALGVIFVAVILANGSSKRAKDDAHQKSTGISGDRINIEVQLRLLSAVQGSGQYSDHDFLSQKKNSLMLHSKQITPETDEAAIVDYIFQNLPQGTWIADIDEPETFSDGEKVAIGDVTITIADGRQYLGYRFKRIDAEAKRLFNEDVIVEMIRVGVWISTNPTKGIKIETVRLYPFR